jgi:hypothetical protein
MMTEPSKFATARAALEQAEADLGNPSTLGDLRNVISFLLRELSGASPQIEKDISTRLVLTYRNKVLSEVRAVVADLVSYEPEFLEYWYKVMDLFEHRSLAEDPEFNDLKSRILTTRNRQPVVKSTTADVGLPKKPSPVSHGQDDLHWEVLNKVRSMLHAKSLRVIGQSLELLRLREFRLRKNGDFFLVQSESLTTTHQWILKDDLAKQFSDSPEPDQKNTLPAVSDGWLCYGPHDIARLDAREKQKRNPHAFVQQPDVDRLAELLRTVGEHLDHKGAINFNILWARAAVSVAYQTPNEAHEHKDFTVEKLQQLATYSRFRRSSGSPTIRAR